jgi:outer membrane protein assembly factor BamB
VLIALNASTGAMLWKFNTLVGPAPGVRKLGLGAGGAWETPLVSGDGSVTYGTGNPYQTPTEALSHPAAMPYTNSGVKLDAATGKLRWYYQGVPNDFKDYDMQTSPISARAGGAPVVIGSGKMGYVYEMNADTGKLIWKTPVGEHNVYVATSNLPLTYTTFSLSVPVKSAGLLKGDVEALNLATGKVQWDTKVASLPVADASREH